MSQMLLSVRSYFLESSKLKNVLFVSALMYILFEIYFAVILKYDLYRTDVWVYWKDSFNWKTPFSSWWVPGYSLLIALVRLLTFSLLSPVATMSLISGFFYLLAVTAVYKILENLKVNNAYYITLIFAAYPFIGLTESVNPRADITAIALTALCILTFEKKKWIAFTIFAAAAIMIHKATWFLVMPLMAFAFFKYKSSRYWLPLAVLPLMSWIVCGAVYHKNILWFMHYAVNNLMNSSSSLPVFNGVFGPVLSAETSKIIKGIIISLVFGLAVLGGYYSFRIKYWPGLFICLSIFIMAAVLNEYEIWAVVRFSRLIIIPIAFILGSLKPGVLCYNKYIFLSILLAGILSNLMFGYYMTTA